MKNKLVLALAASVLMAVPAFAAVQNVKVSGDVDSWYIGRDHFNLGQKVGTGSESGLSKQSIFVTATRLRVDADLSDNVSTTVRLINERAWGTGGNKGGDAEVDLDLAYVTLREFLYSPLSVTVGRQEFVYGSGLIIGGGPAVPTTGGFHGAADDLDKKVAQDGIKLVFDYKPLTLDLVYMRAKTGDATGAIDTGVKKNVDVFGTNANYQLGDSLNTVLEGYFWARVAGDQDASVNGAVAQKGDQLYVPGLRVSTNPVKGLNVQAELAWQLGRKGYVDSGAPASGDNIRREAMAYQIMASYAIPVAELEKYKTSVNAGFLHVSGDKNANVNRDSTIRSNSGEVYSAWDPFQEGQGAGTIYNAIFNLTNMNIVSVGASAVPLQDVTTSFTWSHLMADKKYSTQNALAINQPDSGATTLSPNTTSSKYLGNEYDVNVNYAYTEDVTLGLMLGWFVPGSTFANSNDSTASQALAHVNVNF